MSQNEKKPNHVIKERPGLTPSETVVRILAGIGCAVALLLLVFAVAGFAGMSVLWNDAVDYINEDIIPQSYYTFGSRSEQAQTSSVWVLNRETGEYEQQMRIDATVNRVWVEYKDIPQDIIDAAIAIEDKRFMEHDGVDWKRTVAACANMFLGGSTYGGSTITQQTLKNDTHEDEVTVRRKLTEIFRALELEKHYSKEEILERYFNVIYLGEGCTGIQSASRVYFGKDVNELTTKECACLIGITNNPSMFDPYLHPVANERRTRIILGEMLGQGKLTQEEYDSALEQTLVFRNNSGEDLLTCESCRYTADRRDFKVSGGWHVCPACDSQTVKAEEPQTAPSGDDGPAVDPAEPAEVTDPSEAAPEETLPVSEDPEAERSSIDGNTGNGGYYTYFEDQVIRDVITGLTEEYGLSYEEAASMVASGGLQIMSTVDPDVQAIVDEIYTDLNNIPAVYSSHQLQSGIVVIDNETGDIVAIRGGVGEKTGSLVLNRATQSVRPLGSAIKPVTVYAPAIEYGLVTPATIIEDSPFREENGRGWPLNDGRFYSGWMLLTTGISRSINTVAVKTLAMVTPRRSFDFATEQLGMNSMLEARTVNGVVYTDIDYAPLALGQLTYGVTVRETANAFAAFPNGGVYREARTFVKVLDNEGNVLLDNTQESHRAMSERTAWYINYLLQNAVTSGTGTPAYFGATAVAGKTGTTTDDKDRWFIGYTTKYTVGVWCGFDTPEEINLVKNKNPACVLFKKVMEKIYKVKKLPYEDFFQPSQEEVVWTELCSQSGLLPCADCGQTTWVKLLKSDVPTQTCDNLTPCRLATCTFREWIPATATSAGYWAERESLANDLCREYYRLTHSADFILLVQTGQLDLTGLLPQNEIDSIMQNVHARNTAGADDLVKQACETCGLEDCPWHTGQRIDALRSAIEAAKAAAVWDPEPEDPGDIVLEPKPTEPTDPEPTQPADPGPTDPTDPTDSGPAESEEPPAPPEPGPDG